MKRWLPLIAFAVLALLLGFGLKNAGTKNLIPSPLIDKSAPDFNLPLVGQPEVFVSKADLLGTTYLLNVWGSWCVACRVEHPFMNQLSRSGILPVYGLNWKDEPDEAIAWLKQFGDPYSINMSDYSGRTAIDFGVYGAPESFIIDSRGNVRYKHVGVLNQQIFEREIRPLLATIEGEVSGQ
ncbi:MAG: DsbE family thiol:disulfide interchange protein [Xanthomonadales bacterium]|nr:DsbE family thiol:disulfide interchange protein [Xanthomonadales bacterium]